MLETNVNPHFHPEKEQEVITFGLRVAAAGLRVDARIDRLAGLDGILQREGGLLPTVRIGVCGVVDPFAANVDLVVSPAAVVRVCQNVHLEFEDAVLQDLEVCTAELLGVRRQRVDLFVVQ